MVRNGILDDLQELLLRVGALDGEPVEELDHQAGETLECSRNTDRRRDFDEHTLSGLNVDLELPGLVNGRVEEGEQTLSAPSVSRKPHVGWMQIRRILPTW